MNTAIYINIPVKDTKKTRLFFTELGFTFNETFSNEEAICMVLNEQASVMMLSENFFKKFTTNTIADAHETTEVLLSIEQESRESVNSFIEKAISIGGREAREIQDLDFMYSRSFHDLDGHIWEVGWMDMANFKPQS